MASAVHRLGVLAILVALLAAGCSSPSPVPTPTPSTVTTPPTTPVHRNASAEIVSIDGRWPIPQDAASSVTKAAFGAEPGALIVGEASFGRAAAPVAALDARAAELLGGVRDAATNASVAPPARGDVLVTQRLLDAAMLHVGETATLVTYAFPPSIVTSAFEMERVRPCDSQFPTALCSRQNASGIAVLALTVPEGSTDLQFHPDVIELRPDDFPAFWNGTIEAPDGTSTPFATGAYDRANTLPSGSVAGPLAPGTWTIRFTLDVHHARAPGAIAGFITFRTLGFSPFDTDLLRLADTAAQTRALLANATRHEATLRVAGVISPNGAPAIAGRAEALLALDDARELLSIGPGNVTALVVPSTAKGDDALATTAGASTSPAVRALRARAAFALPPSSAPPLSAPSPSAPSLVWAPADAAGAPLVAELLAPLGAEVKINGTPIAAPPRMLALPNDRAGVPWSLVPKAFWPNTTAALAGIASGPHLVLLGDDLVVAAGLRPSNATYVRSDLDTALGTRTVFGMGAVSGGPPNTVWVSAALLRACGGVGGARIVTSDANATLAAVPGAALWIGP